MELDFERLAAIRARVDVPLVLHGASGLPDEDVQRAIELGVAKVNVNTELRRAFRDAFDRARAPPAGDDLALAAGPGARGGARGRAGEDPRVPARRGRRRRRVGRSVRGGIAMSGPRHPREALAARLRAGEPLTGLVVKMPSPWLLELAGRSGFDFAVIDTEHGPAEVDALEHHLRAADCVGLPALVRVATGARDEVLHALDAGAAGVVVPHVADAHAADELVRAAHYPPRGERGLATSTRAGYHGTVSVSEHVRNADASTLVVAQVEDAQAVAHAAAIAAIPGVDAVFLGAADLAMSLGHPGEPSHPAVAGAIDEVVRAVRERAVADGGAALCVVAGEEHEARAWRERGAQLVAFVAPVLVARCLGAVAAAAGASRGEIPQLEATEVQQ